MTKKVYTILLLLLVSIGGVLNAQTTVQAGVSLSGTSLIISARPNGIINGSYSAGNVTIIWPTSYGISIGAVTSTVGGPWAQQDSVRTSGPNSYVDIGWAGGVATINWASGDTNELFRVAINQTGNGTGTFTLTNSVGGGWYFEMGTGEITNYSTPFYSSSVDGVPLPVQLLAFNGIAKGRKIELNWKTATEVNSSTFEIERRMGSAWDKIGETKAAGVSNKPQEYTYEDDLTNVGKGNILYRLKTVDHNGSYTYSAEIAIAAIPTVYALEHNYPNPFNPQTKIQYSLPEDAKVRLVVYDILGRQVAELVNEEQSAGYYEKTFTGLNLSSGIYFYRIVAQAQDKHTFTQVKKMLLLK